MLPGVEKCTVQLTERHEVVYARLLGAITNADMIINDEGVQLPLDLTEVQTDTFASKIHELGYIDQAVRVRGVSWSKPWGVPDVTISLPNLLTRLGETQEDDNFDVVAADTVP